MDFKGLFEALAGYVNFVIDFIQLSGMEPYEKLGKVSPTLVSYFVVSVTIAYLMSSVKKPLGYDKGLSESNEEKATAPSKDLVDLPNMAQFIIWTMATGFITHISLVLYGKWVDPSLQGSVHDTLNAILALNTILHPIAVAVTKTISFINFDDSPNRLAIASRTFYLRALVGIIWLLLVYYIYALAAVHKTTWLSACFATIGAFFIGIIVMLPFYLFYKGFRFDDKKDVEEEDAGE